MVDLVDEKDIESIVGVNRHPTEHWGRAISDEEMFYILHSEECLNSGEDLRECPFSLSLDYFGIDGLQWEGYEDLAVRITIDPSLQDIIPFEELT